MSNRVLSDVKAALERAVGDNQNEKHWLLNFNKADMLYVNTAVTVCRQAASGRRDALRLLVEFFRAEERQIARGNYTPTYDMGREQIYYIGTYFNHLLLLPPEWGEMIDKILDILTAKEVSHV